MAEIYLLIDLGVRKASACMGGTMVWNDIPS